jgi:membrane-associated phospholipid phosphatase
MMRIFSKRVLLLVFILVLSVLIYIPLNRDSGNLHSLKTFLDDGLPVVPIFVVPYLLFYPILLASLIYLFIKERKVFFLLAIAYLIVNMASSLVYVFAQTVVSRPQITGADFFSGLLRDLYSFDNPYSAWPSLHVAHSVVLSLGWLKIGKRVGFLSLGYALIIAASTVLLKQHYLADVLGGIIFAVLGYLLAVYIRKRLLSSDILGSRKNLSS